MTQSSTIVYKRPTLSAFATPLVIASIAVAMAVGIGLGFLASNVDATSAAQEIRNVSASTHEQFLRMNTEDLDYLAPIGLVPPVMVVTSAADPFMVRNVDSYQWINEAMASRQKVGSYFYEMNTSAMASSVSNTTSPAPSGQNVITDSEPFGEPNRELLQTYLGAEPKAGVR